MSQINVSNLTFSYEGSYDNIFENVSFQIDTDWRLGFIGRNGRGKTTFLKILMGEYEYRGAISSSVVFDYFPFDIRDKSQNTLDAVYTVSPDAELWQLNKELSLLEVSEDVLYRPFNTLSNGEQTKVLLASLFLKDNNFLLIDEPTNHLDAGARAVVSNYLKTKKGFILVSHDRMLLDNCIDHVLSINKADIEIRKGDFSSWWKDKQDRDDSELAENDRLQKEIKKLSESAKRTATWSDKVEKSKNKPLSSGLSPDRGYIGHKAAKMMKRSKVIEARQQNRLDEKSKLLKNLENSETLSIKPIAYHTDKMVEFSDVSIYYGDRTVCENVSFIISRGDRIALKGRNGSGKSSILKLLLAGYGEGNGINYSGKLKIGGNLVISYISQDTSFLKGDLRKFARDSNVDESLFKAILRKLDFSRIQFEKNMEDFSGGQKKKVLLAKSLCERAHLYIWDEPLNFIDVLSRMQIEDLILIHKPAMIFVEHDGVFAGKIATKTVQL